MQHLYDIWRMPAPSNGTPAELPGDLMERLHASWLHIATDTQLCNGSLKFRVYACRLDSQSLRQSCLQI